MKEPVAESTKAVFLSYASEDGEVAARICASLRSAGIEVWFDQSELRGGDVWDASIRRQIKACSLFVPLISKHTRARQEGYFRLEWKLAVDRSHLMSASKAFLVPIVIDDTRDDEEHVPDRFHEVQWVRLPAGQPPPAFVERVGHLLSADGGLSPIAGQRQVRSAQPIEETYFGPPPTVRLPSRIEALIGREQELAQLSQLLSQHREVTLLGTGGMGKTQCALEFARLHAGHFPDGVWFFDLAPMHSAAEWLQGLGRALAIVQLDEQVLLAQICSALAGRRALLLLDNCDQIAAAIGAQVFAVLRGVDDIKILATSRQPLSFLGERLMQLHPLALPDEVAEIEMPRDLARVEASAAVSLLITRVRMIQPGFILTSANAPSVVDICRRLDGMPLALELAAARFALLSPRQVLERLEHRFSFLASDVAGRDQRHRNLLALLDWSHSLLSPEDQRLLAWMSVFVQSWSVEAASEVTAAQGADPATGVELLASLVGKSFVAVDASLTPPRYRLLETVREFALSRLRESQDEMRARDCQLAYVRRMAEQSHHAIVSGNMGENVAQLLHEHGNIDAALQHAVMATRGGELALATVGFLLLYLKGHGAHASGRLWCLRALEIPGPADAAERGRALLTLGVTGVYQKNTHFDADDSLVQAARIAEQHNDRWAQAYACGFRALNLASDGDAEAAIALADTTAQIAHELGDPLLQGLAGLAHGWIRMLQGGYADALTALRAVRSLGHDLHQHHFIDMYIGLTAFSVGDDRAAAASWQAGMRGSLAVSNLRGVAGSIEGCAYIAARQQRYPEAARLLAFASRIRERSTPLFSFWLAHHDHAERATRAALSAADWAACTEVGRTMREEDAINQTAALLQFFSEPQA